MFEKIKNFIVNEKKIDTLKMRSAILAKVDGINIVITNSRGKCYMVDENLFNKILNRFNELDVKDRFTASQYTDPKWVDCPNRVASVYVAAIIKKYFEVKSM